MNSSGDITMCLVPSRQAVLSLSTTCPAALICTRSRLDREAGPTYDNLHAPRAVTASTRTE